MREGDCRTRKPEHLEHTDHTEHNVPKTHISTIIKRKSLGRATLYTIHHITLLTLQPVHTSKVLPYVRYIMVVSNMDIGCGIPCNVSIGSRDRVSGIVLSRYGYYEWIDNLYG